MMLILRNSLSCRLNFNEAVVLTFLNVEDHTSEQLTTTKIEVFTVQKFHLLDYYYLYSQTKY